MSDNESAPTLGPWLGDDIDNTVAAYAGDGSDDDVDPVRRFGRNVCRLTLRRMRQHRGDMRRDAIAIFVFHPDAPSCSATKREPLLGDGGVEVCGKIWFVNVTAQSGRSIDVDCAEDDSMFGQVEKLGLGGYPTAVYNPKVSVPMVRIYEKGLVNEECIEAVSIVDQEVGSNDIESAIDRMAEKYLCTPESQVPGASMWANAPKFHAASNAEALAQLQVRDALSYLLFNCEVRSEQAMRAGRTDLEVVQQLYNGATVTPAEIEIKVLRERNRRGRKWSDMRNRQWLRRGIRQAAAYRDDRNAKVGILCCFDMRDGDRGHRTTFAVVKPYADTHDVILHRNYLYNSSEVWRQAKYGD